MAGNVILLVEDNADDEMLTMRALKKNNIRHDVVVARDGAEALDYVFARGQHANRGDDAVPHLVLLDINLPKINGLEVLRALRANPRTSLVPVVILTSSKEDRDLREGYASGANSYVRKPVDFREFAQTIQHLGTYWLMVNQQPPIHMDGNA